MIAGRGELRTGQAATPTGKHSLAAPPFLEARPQKRIIGSSYRPRSPIFAIEWAIARPGTAIVAYMIARLINFAYLRRNFKGHQAIGHRFLAWSLHAWRGLLRRFYGFRPGPECRASATGIFGPGQNQEKRCSKSSRETRSWATLRERSFVRVMAAAQAGAIAKQTTQGAQSHH